MLDLDKLTIYVIQRPGDKITNPPLEVKKFLNSSFPDRVNSFSLNKSSKVIDVGNFLDSLVYLAPCVKETTVLSCFKIKSSQLGQLLNAFKHCTNLEFRDCKINIDAELESGLLDGWKTELIFFDHKKFGKCGWDETLDAFEYLVKFLGSNEDVVEHLRVLEIKTHNDKPLEDALQELLDQNGLKGTRVVGFEIDDGPRGPWD